MTVDSKHLADVIMRAVHTLQVGGSDEVARAQVAADIDALRGVVAETSGAVPPGVDLARLAEGLRLFADWLHDPTTAKELRAEHAMTQLQATLGPAVGWDPDREDRARKAQYRAEARAKLDEIFSKNKK